MGNSAFLRRITNFKGKQQILRILYLITEILSLGINSLFLFTIPYATKYFKEGKVDIAIFLLCITIMQGFLKNLLSTLISIISRNYGIMQSVENTKRSIEILSKVKGKIYLKEGHIKKVVTSKEILENSGDYIRNKIDYIDDLITEIFNLIVFLFTLTGTVYTTVSMSPVGISELIFNIIVCLVVILLVTYFQIKRRKEYFSKMRKIQNKARVAEMDLINCNSLNEKHQDFLGNTHLNLSKHLMKETYKIELKESFEYTGKYMIISAIVIFLMFTIVKSYEELQLGDFISLISLMVMYNGLISLLESKVSSIQHLVNSRTNLKSYNEMMNMIANEYLKADTEDSKNYQAIEKIEIKKLEFSHRDSIEEVVHKIRCEDFEAFSGKSVLIFGLSGSGKSTFFKILTGYYGLNEKTIFINETRYVNKIYRNLFYDPDSNFGNKSILEEITFTNEEDINIYKLFDILKGLDMIDFIESKKKDLSLLEFLKYNFKESFSAGQLQRFLLARILYNLDGTTESIILDEPTANLDNETALKIMEFIKSFVNLDRKRILIIASHQVHIAERICDVKYKFVLENTNDYILEKVN